MQLSLSTWNSQNINNGSPFYAAILRGQLANLINAPILVDRAGEYPALAGVKKQGSTINIQVRLAPGSNINTYREVLKGYFFGDTDNHNLVALDTADSNKPYYRSGIPVRLVEDPGAPNSWIITIQTDYPYWELVSAASTTWAVTSSGDTEVIANGGNLPIIPKFTITPNTTKTGGLSYRRYVPIYNNLEKSWDKPLDITDGGLATNSLVASTAKSNQINEAGNINDAVTTWNIDTSVGGGLPTTGGMFYVDSEQCTYTAIAAGVISGVTRGVNGTTAASHLNNAVMYLSKVQADGSDLRLWMDGSFADRWLYGMNGAATQIWANINLGPKLEGSVNTTINNSATTLTFSQTKANMDFLTRLGTTTNRTLLIESEAVVFETANINLVAYTITGIVRGQKDTTAASHTAPFTVRYIEHDLWILYGDSSLSDREQDDDREPIMDLSSTNEAWTFTNYFDSTASRPGAWRGELQATRTKLSYPYTGADNTFTDPSDTLGLAEVNSRDFTVGHEGATIAWSFSHVAGITDVTYSGDKYMTGSWPGIVGLQYLQSNVAWFTINAEAEPGLTYSWESFGPNAVALGSTYENIRFVIDGVLSSTIDEAALIQFDTVSLTFDPDNLPTIAMVAEASINFFDFKITNTSNGSEYLQVTTPCKVGDDLVVDCTLKTAYLEDGRTVPVALSSDRAAWLTLLAGNNTLSWTDVGTVDVTVVVAHRDRNL